MGSAAVATLCPVTRSPLAPPPLRVHTRPIGAPASLLSQLPLRDGFAWVRKGEGMVAWGEAVRHKPATIAEAEEWWGHLTEQTEVVTRLDDEPAGAGLIAFGSFVFDAANTEEQSRLVVPQTVIGFRDGRAWRTDIGPARPDDSTPIPPPRPPRGVRWAPGALSEAAWERAVADAVGRIGRGALDKVVLARDVIATAEEDLDPRWLASRLTERYGQCWTYIVDGLVGATPEMLVKREAGLVTSRVLAGTIRRSTDPQHDLNLAAALSQSSKDLEEHEYAVRSVARALRPYCSGMNVPDAPYVLELPNVLHLATDVTAAAHRKATALTLVRALHPSAAVCGTPTDAARSLIAELEHLDRERYAGPVGWIDARGDGEWAIALRCGQISQTDPRQIRLFAGCGIVAGSDPAAELAEAQAKLIPMRESLL